LELQKDFLSAFICYENAVEHAPGEAIFQKAVKKISERLGIKVLANGYRVSTLPYECISSHINPSYIAWNRLKKESNDLQDLEKAFPKRFDPSSGEDIKSYQWISQGLHQWYSAMGAMLGELATVLNHPDVLPVKSQLDALSALKETISEFEFDARYRYITECPPCSGFEFQSFLNALTHLSGEHIPFESGGGKLVPSPGWLKWYLPQQFTATTMTLFLHTVWCTETLGKGDMIVSDAILESQATFLCNFGQTEGPVDKAGTPEEVMAYCKKKLHEGVTWDGGMRKFVSLLYRGTVLYGFFIRNFGRVAESLKAFKWARKFIDFADAEWRVTAEKSYDEKGSCFRKSFQITVLSMELSTARTIRCDRLPTLEVAEYEFNLAQEIINIARNEKVPDDNVYQSWMVDVAFRRKPLAHACKYLAGTMNEMMVNPKLLLDVINKIGMAEVGRDDNLYSFLDETATQTSGGNLNSLIAETYKHAAMNQLDDDTETTILWWGYAAHMARAGAYKIGDLRLAINSAYDASQKRDAELFGPEPWKGSTFQMQAMILARHFSDKRDDFVLPPLEFSRRPDGSLALFAEGQVLSMNFDRFMRSESKRAKKINKHSYLDNSELENEHGAGTDYGFPPR